MRRLEERIKSRVEKQDKLENRSGIVLVGKLEERRRGEEEPAEKVRRGRVENLDKQVLLIIDSISWSQSDVFFGSWSLLLASRIFFDCHHGQYPSFLVRCL